MVLSCIESFNHTNRIYINRSQCNVMASVLFYDYPWKRLPSQFPKVTVNTFHFVNDLWYIEILWPSFLHRSISVLPTCIFVEPKWSAIFSKSYFTVALSKMVQGTYNCILCSLVLMWFWRCLYIYATVSHV